jgi:hypothetical protein
MEFQEPACRERLLQGASPKYAALPLDHCGGGELRVIAAILKQQVIERILCQLGPDPQPPPKGRARKAGQDFPA